MNEYTVLCDDGLEITVHAKTAGEAHDFATQHGRRVAEVTLVPEIFPGTHDALAKLTVGAE